MARKNASLTLSINAIVVLILAITILGLGLGFIKSMFSGTSRQIDIKDAELKADLIQELESSGDKLTFKQSKFEVKSGTPFEFYIGIRNTADTPMDFYFQFACEDELDTGNCYTDADANHNWKWFTTYPYIRLEPQESEAFPARVQPEGRTNTYGGKLYVWACSPTTDCSSFDAYYSGSEPVIPAAPDPTAQLYETKDFYITVI